LSSLLKVVDIYEKYGYKIRTGLYPWHFNSKRFWVLPFTRLFKDGAYLDTGGGISMQEIFFLEQLFNDYHPSNIFIVGNAFGFSTILISLLNSSSRVVAIDAGIEGYNNDDGIILTNQIARENKLNCEVVKGYSPQDVGHIVQNGFNGKIDFAFIDGLHTNDQMYADFEECYRYANPDCIYLLHDVLNYNLKAGFEKIKTEKTELSYRILWRTPSGMAVCYPPSLPCNQRKIIESFSENNEFIEQLIREERIYKITKYTPKFLKTIVPKGLIAKINNIIQSYIFYKKTP
jgi:predicted O-methyltransferase YrrM